MAQPNERRLALDTVGMGSYAGVGDGRQESQGSIDEQLLQMVKSHITAETESLEAYGRLSEATGDPMVNEILSILMEEEERHHRTLERLSATWTDDLNWTHSSASFPTQPMEEARQAGFIDQVKTFIKEEESGIKDFQSASKEARKGRRMMSAMMLEWMAMDGKKHVQGLQYLLRRLEGARR
ncbi:MAG: hypothetical protein EXR51_02545 [Dehalococcoidia bacterium]|nr:hypothetical protein [Dehalococcoidia bacterium]